LAETPIGVAAARALQFVLVQQERGEKRIIGKHEGVYVYTSRKARG